MDFENTLDETRDIVKSGTAAIHLCGDDYSRIDEFVKQLAEKLGFVNRVEIQVPGEEGPEIQTTYKPFIVEWNYGYGQVDFETRAVIGKTPEGKVPFPKFLENYKDKQNARNRIILIRNARHVLEGEINGENLAQLQQTIVFLRKNLSGKTVLIYCDEKRFIPDELSSLVYFLEIKPPSQEKLTEIARNFIYDKKIIDFDNGLSLIDELSSKCIGMSEDTFMQILKKVLILKL
jgi:hypothetical protein